MSNLDSTISRINRRIREIVQTFGLHSREYMQYKSTIEQNIPDVLLTTKKNEPLRISRSKSALRGLSFFGSGISSILEWMSGKTAYQMAKKYDTSSNFSKLRFSSEKNRIRKLAIAAAAQDSVIVDYYDAIDEISDSAAENLARRMFSNVSQKGETREEHMARYEEVAELIRQELMKQGSAIKSGTYREPSEAQKVAQQKPTTIGQLFRK